MEYVLSDDLLKIVGLSALFGAIGGLTWDIANQIRAAKAGPKVGLDNRLVLPRVSRVKGSRVVDLGFLGPMAVGAVAAILLVLLVGRTGPDADDAAEAILQVSQQTASGGGDAQAAEKVAEDALSTRIDLITIILIGIASGIGGWPLIQRVTGRLTGMVESLLGETVEAGSKAAEQKVLEAATEEGITDEDTRRKLAEAAASAVRDVKPTVGAA